MISRNGNGASGPGTIAAAGSGMRFGARSRPRPAASRPRRCSRVCTMPDPLQIAFPWLAGQDQDQVPPSPARTSRKRLCSLVMHKGDSVAITLAQAAEATGRNRSTILRSIRRGTLSATRDQRTQAWMVDPAELFRVFPPVPALGDTEANQGNAQAPRADDAAESR